jgi:AAA+ ATPase superfamily predicted ATPase
MIRNPFFFREISRDEPFCNRQQEFRELTDHANSLANVVLFSPRRFGKTSLVKRVQKKLSGEGAICIYTDFFGITSVEDVAARLAKSIFKEVYNQESLFKKAARIIKSFRPSLVMSPNEKTGFSVSVQMAPSGLTGFALLEDLLESFGNFIDNCDQLVHVCLDEFQEITSLPEALKIEGLMRQYIQQHRAAYIFVGSRRRILLSIFNEAQRPFYQSAINYELEPLPRKEFARFIAEQFSKNSKTCSINAATQLVVAVDCFPYYAQKLAYFIFQNTKKMVRPLDVQRGLKQLIKSEVPAFEGILLGLTPVQIGLIRALTVEPAASLFNQEYIQRHRLGSLGGVQAAKKKLLLLDLIEEHNKVWRLVDPIFKEYLKIQG